MIDNQLRSVLFQIPVSGNPRCLDGAGLPECFRSVVDLGALDVERGRDHGMPSYNDLRRAYGLRPKASFTDITGEATESFPRSDPELTSGKKVDDPESLDFVRLFDVDGRPIDPDSEDAEDGAVTGVRRTTLAARLKAVYGSVNALDAFTGMVAERHARGSEFGELQYAIWARQFQALRDGDRFFYGNDPTLWYLRRAFGIDYRTTLAQMISRNTDVATDELNDDVFLVGDSDEQATEASPTASPSASVASPDASPSASDSAEAEDPSTASTGPTPSDDVTASPSDTPDPSTPSPSDPADPPGSPQPTAAPAAPAGPRNRPAP
jgi:hypothetical protein